MHRYVIETGKSAQLMFRRPTLDQNNRLFTALVIGWGGVLGSVVSFLFVGAILAAFLRLYQRKISVPADWNVKAVAAAFAFYFLAHAISGALNYEGWNTVEEVGEALPFLGVLFVYGRLSLSSRHDILRAVQLGAILGAFATLVFVLVEVFFLDHRRAEGLAGNPGVLAVVCSVLYGLCILGAVQNRGYLRWIALFAALSAAASILATGMRALWPFLLIGPLIPLVLLRPKFDWRLVRRVLVVAAIPAAVAIQLSHQLVEERFGRIAYEIERVQLGDYDSSIGKRLVLWDAGVKLAMEKPLFGFGPAAAQSESIGFSHFHNFLLNSMIKTGIVGVAAMLGMFLVPLWIAIARRHDDVSTSGLAMLIVVQSALLLSGSVGIMLGHDIHDTLFIYGTIVASFLVLGSPASVREVPAAVGESVIFEASSAPSARPGVDAHLPGVGQRVAGSRLDLHGTIP